MPIWSYPWNQVVDPLAIPSGALRHSIQIYSNTTTQDALGTPVPSLTPVMSCFAAIETTSMKEQFQEGFVSQVIYRITIRFPGFDVPITAAMTIKRGGSFYQIQAVENVQQRNRVLHMTCIQINDQKAGM